jgi:oligoendopeptidase F
MGVNNEPPRWDLSPLVESEDPELVKKALDDTLQLAEGIEDEYKGRIKDLSPAGICELYKKYDHAYSSRQPIMDYTELRQIQDAADSTGSELHDYALRVWAEFDSKLAFFEIEVASVLKDRPEIINDPALREYRHALEKARESGKYVLSERDEQLIINKDLHGIDSWSLLQEKLTSTRQYEVVIKNETKTLSVTELTNITKNSSDREVRKAATEALYKGLSSDRLVFSTALKCIFGDHLDQVKLRGQPSVLTQSLLFNDIDQVTLDTLIASLKQNTHLIKKYLNLRARLMGIEKLTGYDIAPTAVPPLAEFQSDVPWSEAKRIIIESYTGFDREAGEYIESLFEQRRIDASVRPGKSGTVFCRSFPSLRTSWINLNYGGSLNTVTQLAHELGHALHAHYASQNHKWTNFQAGMCLAETGSLFGEMLLGDKLIVECDSEDAKLTALARVLDSLYVIVFHILNRYLFELSVFTAMENKERIDAERLDSLWAAARTEVFSDSVDWSPGMEQYWALPSHHFMARFRFYNYPYAFALLLVFILYQLYKEEGKSFVPKMKRLLSAGGSESPEALLAEMGLDMTNPKFWDTGFKLAGSYLDEFEQIVNRRT